MQKLIGLEREDMIDVWVVVQGRFFPFPSFCHLWTYPLNLPIPIIIIFFIFIFLKKVRLV